MGQNGQNSPLTDGAYFWLDGYPSAPVVNRSCLHFSWDLLGASAVGANDGAGVSGGGAPSAGLRTAGRGGNLVARERGRVPPQRFDCRRVLAGLIAPQVLANVS